MLMVRNMNDFVNQMMGFSIHSKAGLKRIEDAGIDTNSKAYQIVISDMESRAGNGIAYTNPEAIKNRMAQYDSNGNWTDRVMSWNGGFMGDEYEWVHCEYYKK